MLTAGAAAVVAGCTTIFRGALPTGIVAFTERSDRSTTLRSLEFSLVTYAQRLSEVTPIQCGIVPTFTLPVSVYVAGSNISSVPGPWLTTRPSLPSGVNNGWWGEAPVGTCVSSWSVARSRTCNASTPASVKASSAPSGLTFSARGEWSSGTEPVSVPLAMSMMASCCSPSFWPPAYAVWPSGVMAMLCGCGTGTCHTTELVPVSMASTLSVPKPETSTLLPSGVIARPCGVWPTLMVLVTVSVVVSMTDTTESPSLLAYTQRPSGVTTRPCGPVGIGMVFVMALVAVSKTPTALSLNRPMYAFGAVAAPADAGAMKTLLAASAAPASSVRRRLIIVVTLRFWNRLGRR